MQEIMTCQNCLIGWMESAARNFTYPLGMKTALYKKRKKVEKSPFFRFFRFYNKCWGEEIFFPHPIFA